MLNFFLKKKNGIFTKFALFVFLAVNLLPAATPALGQNFSPQYPARIKAIAEELSDASGELVAINQDLKAEASQCSCNSAISICVQKKAVPSNTAGDPCENREYIEEIQVAIRNKTDQVSYLIALLEAEMEAGLEDELNTLAEDEAQAIRTEINNLLESSKRIVAPSLANANALDNDNYSSQNKCQANCNRAFPLSFKICVNAQGEQKPIEMNFQVSASLKKLDLGQIEIKKFGLNLPDKLKLSGIGLLNDFSLALPDISLEFPPTPVKNLGDASLDPIVLHSFSASLPSFNPAKFSCNRPDSSQYSCYGVETIKTATYIESEWYAQTISWLSDRCQEIPTMKGELGMPIEEKTIKCFDAKNVQKTIVEECDAIWKQFIQCLIVKVFTFGAADCPLPTGICWRLKQPDPPEKRQRAAAEQCSALFQGQNEAVPAGCGSDPANTLKNKCEAIKDIGINKNQCATLFKRQGETAPVECDSKPLETFENKCEEIKNSGAKNIPEPCFTIPDPCFFVPLLTDPPEAVTDLSTQYFQGDKNSCIEQTIGDNSLFEANADCPLSLNYGTSAPRIKLPGVKIPDIRLPSFNFSPFLKVKLPNFIFEDLAFPDMDLCNISDCADMLGELNLNVAMPTLRIPDIQLPDIFASLGIPGLNSKIRIQTDKIRFPAIQMPVPDFDLLKFAAPKITLPKISMPRPQIKVDFKGVKINLPNLLLGLLGSIFNIPSGCVGLGFGLSGLPLEIIFPDYYFYWPRFPRIPDLCEEVDSFCRQLKNALDETIGSRIGALQDAANNPIQTGIQEQLDEIAIIYKQAIEKGISDKMEEIKNKIETAARNAAIFENGLARIPKTTIPLGWITIPMSGVNSKLNKLPLEINFNWPGELKELQISNPVVYQLPSIHLENLNFSRDIKLKLPGLQLPSFSFDISFSDDYVDVAGGSPSGGNPYPMNQIDSNLQTIIEKSDEITDASENIIDVLK